MKYDCVITFIIFRFCNSKLFVYPKIHFDTLTCNVTDSTWRYGL